MLRGLTSVIAIAMLSGASYAASSPTVAMLSGASYAASSPTVLPEWEVDYAASQIEFTANVNNAPSKGRFKEFDADISFHPAFLDTSVAFIEISTLKLDTDYPEVASNLITDVWFDAREHPVAYFEATRFTTDGKGTYIAHGTLTLKDIDQDIELPFSFVESADGSALVKGMMTIKRSDFNVGTGDWAAFDVVKDEVTLMIELNAQKIVKDQEFYNERKPR